MFGRHKKVEPTIISVGTREGYVTDIIVQAPTPEIAKSLVADTIRLVYGMIEKDKKKRPEGVA